MKNKLITLAWALAAGIGLDVVAILVLFGSGP
jgi:hypothetical protein